MGFSLGRFTQNPDPLLARLNVFALMLAVNQLLYAPSLMLMVGHEGIKAWPVIFAAPAFAATLWIARRSSLSARLWVPLIGISETFVAQFAMGNDCGVWVFVLPSLALAALLLGQKERFYLAGLTVLGLCILALPVGTGIIQPDIAFSIARINEGSAIILTGFIGWLFLRRASSSY